MKLTEKIINNINISEKEEKFVIKLSDANSASSAYYYGSSRKGGSFGGGAYAQWKGLEQALKFDSVKAAEKEMSKRGLESAKNVEVVKLSQEGDKLRKIFDIGTGGNIVYSYQDEKYKLQNDEDYFEVETFEEAKKELIRRCEEKLKKAKNLKEDQIEQDQE
jgi:hypothetical protein